MVKAKLTDQEKEKIIELFNTKKYTYAALAEKYNVSIKTIQRIVKPSLYKKEKEKISQYYTENKESIQQKHKELYYRVGIKLHNINDKDIIEKLDSESNIQGYIKDLIRADILSDQNKNNN